MKIFKQLKIYIVTFIYIFFITTPMVALADDASDLPNDKYFPVGITSDVFDPVMNNGKQSSNTSQNIFSKNNILTASTGQQTNVFQLNNAKNQDSDVWSKAANDFDLTQPAKLSAWLYFGKGGNGDGMTFTLQNDSRGTTTNNVDTEAGVVPPGQSLGVTPDAASGSTAPGNVFTYIANGSPAPTSYFFHFSVKNSFSVEFDNRINNVTSSNAYDYSANSGSSHIAAMYPSDASSFAYTNKTFVQENHAQLNSFSSSLSTGTWHHFVFTYMPPKTVGSSGVDGQAEISYIFNDQIFNPNTGLITPNTDTSGDSQSSVRSSDNWKLDTSKFYSVNGASTAASHKIKWGFTGANGSNYQNNSVIFESTIGIVTPQTTLNISDGTNSIDSEENPDDKLTVDSGTTLTYTANAKNIGGSANWTKITSDFNLNPNVTPIAGSVAVNGTPVPDATFVKNPQSGDNAYKINGINLPNIAKGTDGDTITFKVTANNSGTTPITINDQMVEFDGVEARSSSTPLSYIINAFTNPVITIDQADPITINDINNMPEISGTANSKNPINRWYVSINGKTVPGLNIVYNNSGDPTKATWSVDWSKVDPGDLEKILTADDQNTFTIQATDSNGKTSNVANTHLKYAGYTTLSSNANSSFKTVMADEDNTAAPRNDDWGLNVDSNNTTPWKIAATATPFENPEGQKLNATYGFVDSKGSFTDWTKDTAIVDSGAGSKDCSSSWINYTDSSNQGFGPYLALNKDNPKYDNSDNNKYSSTITWNLTNSVE